MSEGHYKPALDHGVTARERLTSTRREPGLITTIASTVATGISKTCLKVYHRYSVVGREHLPAKTPFVMVANHSSHLDHACLRSALGTEIRSHTMPLAAGDVFFSSPARAALTSLFVNALPMWRKKVASHALADLRARLEVGDCGFVLFPEGARTRDGNLMKFKAGVGMLVAGLNVPVIPCWIDGAFAALPPHTVLPRPRRITLYVGPPLLFADQPNTREGWDYAISAIEAAVRALRPNGNPPQLK